MTATRESVGHRPSDPNLVRSKDRREDRAICLSTTPIEVTSRWRKSRGKLFWCEHLLHRSSAPRNPSDNLTTPEPKHRSLHPLPSPKRSTEEAGTNATWRCGRRQMVLSPRYFPLERAIWNCRGLWILQFYYHHISSSTFISLQLSRFSQFLF
jgi:hypothetical protein